MGLLMSQSKAKTTNQNTIDSDTKSVINKKQGVANNQLPEFNRSLPMLLLRAREAVMAQFVPALNEFGLSSQQWRVIRSLDQRNGQEISELSKRCHLLKPSMSRIVQNLERRGFIERRTVSSDQRRSELFITDSGREAVQIIAPKSEQRYDYISSRFGTDNQEQLVSLLEELIDSLDSN
jgi:homoprotocatechuate degradation regulator HpaR